jgi:hypothetical protein
LIGALHVVDRSERAFRAVQLVVLVLPVVRVLRVVLVRVVLVTPAALVRQRGRGVFVSRGIARQGS